jgi:hypothetical protein
MADAILETIRRPDEARETAESGRRQVLARYSWIPLAEHLAKVWRSVARTERVGIDVSVDRIVA